MIQTTIQATAPRIAQSTASIADSRSARAARLLGWIALFAVAVVPRAALSAEPPEFAVAEPAMRAITLTGFTRARARLPLIAEVSGRVLTVNYDIGDTIGADAVFAQIDDTFLRLELEQVSVQEGRLRSQIDFDQREVDRYKQLARQNNAAASQLDTYQQTLTNNRHELRRLEVEQRVLEERIARTAISPPTGWRVTARGVEPGQWVNQGEPLGEVADYRTLLVPFALTPEQYTALRALSEQSEGIRLALPDLDRQVSASVLRTNPGFDPDTRKIAVELQLGTGLDSRRGGLRAELRLPIPERSGAVLLPPAAVRQSYDEYWVHPENGDPVRVVLLGRFSGPDGDRLRVSGPGVTPGTRVLLSTGDSAPPDS